MRLRLELTELCCWNPEDHTVADLFYLTGGAAVGNVTAPIAMSPMGMSRGQVRQTWPDQSVILDADVPAGAALNLGMRGFEEDFAGDWSRMRDRVRKLAALVAEKVAAVPENGRASDAVNRERVAAIIRAAAQVFDFFARSDKDDALGAYGVTLPLTGGLVNHGEAQFRGSGWTGDWNYVVRYRYAMPESIPVGRPATYGTATRLMHTATTRLLHSHDLSYRHPHTSGQQQVTGFEGMDDNDLWRIRPAHDRRQEWRDGQQVQNGDVVRLQHVATQRNLHSHPGIPSPVTGQQEVACFGANGVGDTNDDWRVEVEGGGPWQSGTAVRLIHTRTGCALHSHPGLSHPTNTAGQQEVTAFQGRDGNDLWQLVPA